MRPSKSGDTVADALTESITYMKTIINYHAFSMTPPELNIFTTKYLCLGVFAASLAAIHTVCAQRTDLYNSNTGSDFSINDGSSWHLGSYDGQVYAGSINSTNNNLHIQVVGNSSNIGQFSEAVTAHDIDYTIGSVEGSSWGRTLYFNGGAYATGDMAFENTSGSAYVIQLRGGNKTFRIGGDFNLGANSNASMIIHSAQSGWQVGGDFNIGTRGKLYLSGSSTSSFSITGVLNIGGTTLDLAKHDSGGSGEKNELIGGLSGSGRLQIGNTYTSHNLTFTNRGVSEFSGTYATQNGAGGKLNITMNANSDAGRQTLRFNTVADYSDERAFSAADLGSVSVQWGELNLGMHSGMGAGALSISGSSSTFSVAGVDGNAEGGTARFASLDWQGGTIRVDFTELAADRIDVAGELNVSSAADCALVLNVSAIDLGLWLEASEAPYLDYTILSFDAESSNLTLEMANEMLSHDGEINAQILEGDFANGLLTVRLGLVPEPAILAAILGATALAFAIRRRAR